MHFYSQVIIFCTDVLCQQVDGFGTTVTDSDLGPLQEEKEEQINSI